MSSRADSKVRTYVSGLVEPTVVGRTDVQEMGVFSIHPYTRNAEAE